MELTIEKLIKLVNVKEGTMVPYNLHKGIIAINKAFAGYIPAHHPNLTGFEGFIEEIKSTHGFDLE